MLKDDKKGCIVILTYHGTGDPQIALNHAVQEITKDVCFCEFRDARLEIPWLRIIITGINDMDTEEFDIDKHQLANFLKKP